MDKLEHYLSRGKRTLNEVARLLTRGASNMLEEFPAK